MYAGSDETSDAYYDAGFFFLLITRLNDTKGFFGETIFDWRFYLTSFVDIHVSEGLIVNIASSAQFQKNVMVMLYLSQLNLRYCSVAEGQVLLGKWQID
mmetsp:Transcript_15697/g.21523  ORF Transcript_15697/g.21523 Transcript_15697/m.21523 type:complete len:99 (-) Transcript_15697:252-548(-)